MKSITNKTMISLLVLAVILHSAETSRTEGDRRPKEDGDTHAVIVSGIIKDPNESSAKDKIVLNLAKFLLRDAGIKSERMQILTGSDSLTSKGLQASTGEKLEETIGRFADSVGPEDRFIFYYIGQANTVADKLRLNLPGADITHEQLAEWIDQIEASSMLIVLDCPCAETAIKAVCKPGRIVVCSCTADQQYSTRFSEYFVPALADAKSDSDADGRVSLLESFTFASRQVEDWYRKRDLLKTETAILEDNGDCKASRQPWRYKQDETDGQAAARLFLAGE
ncbi:MAG: hypothetical protein ACYS8Z_03030 [Planctomycetota bacterium]|jgi:hypothetical protein